jgi:hypothetical protein
MQSSAALEGLRVKLQFDENITSFTGTVVASQYSGDGPTDARTDLLISVGGQLEKAP